MSLLCRNCDEPLNGEYNIIAFLGHAQTGLIDSKKSMVSQLVCSWHVERLIGIPKKSFTECKGLVFAIITPKDGAQGKNFNSAFSIDQANELKKAMFDPNKVAFLADEDMKTYFSTTFKSLLDEAKKWRGKNLSFYSAAINRYLGGLADQKRQMEDETRANHQRNMAERIELRVKYANLIKTAMAQAVENKTVSKEIIEQLNRAGILEPSTNFRHYSLFPGECSILEVKDEKANFFANLGFDKDSALISIDERFPVNRQLYRKETDEWIEIR